MRKFHKRLCQLCHGIITRFEIRTSHTSADFLFLRCLFSWLGLHCYTCRWFRDSKKKSINRILLKQGNSVFNKILPWRALILYLKLRFYVLCMYFTVYKFVNSLCSFKFVVTLISRTLYHVYLNYGKLMSTHIIQIWWLQTVSKCYKYFSISNVQIQNCHEMCRA